MFDYLFAVFSLIVTFHAVHALEGRLTHNDLNTVDECQVLLKQAGVADNFGFRVAHAIHSMTVLDLKSFDPNANEKNFVPTINKNLTSDQAILPYAPDTKTVDTDRFLTAPMKKLDLILSHMDEKDYDVKGYSTLERVAHVFHMGEVFAQMKIHFDRLKMNPPSNQTCNCVMDVDNNGIVKMLRYNSLAIREPALLYSQRLQDFVEARPYRERYLERQDEAADAVADLAVARDDPEK